jgi:hypothetical protein
MREIEILIPNTKSAYQTLKAYKATHLSDITSLIYTPIKAQDTLNKNCFVKYKFFLFRHERNSNPDSKHKVCISNFKDI